jgi:hypothetical protein
LQIPDHKFYNCIVDTDAGTTHRIDANWLHNNNLDIWHGWKCLAGSDRIFVDSTGLIYSGECRNDLLGQIDSNWQLLENATVCNRDRCSGCTDDLMITKEL